MGPTIWLKLGHFRFRYRLKNAHFPSGPFWISLIHLFDVDRPLLTFYQLKSKSVIFDCKSWMNLNQSDKVLIYRFLTSCTTSQWISESEIIQNLDIFELIIEVICLDSILSLTQIRHSPSKFKNRHFARLVVNHHILMGAHHSRLGEWVKNALEQDLRSQIHSLLTCDDGALWNQTHLRKCKNTKYY